VNNVSQFDRRRFLYSYFPQVPQVPEICLGRQGIRFQDDAFWPIYSPSSIYQNFPGSGSTFTQSVNFHPFLFERFPVDKYVPHLRDQTQTGFPNFMEEVGASTQPRLYFYRGILSDKPGASFPPEGKIVTLQFLVNNIFQVSWVPARQFLQLIGFLISLMDVIPLDCLHTRPIKWYLGEFWHPVTQMWEACIPVFPDYCLIFSGGYRGPTFWQVYLWTPRICTDSLHRHLPNRMGCLPKRKNSVRGVGRLSFRRTHKSSENEGSSIVIETLPVIQRQFLLIAIDNTTVVAYLQNQGGTHFLSLYLLCRQCWQWDMSRAIRIL
jgi:hypothetical protein